jgi:hypothetical protein
MNKNLRFYQNILVFHFANIRKMKIFANFMIKHLKQKSIKSTI